MDDTPNMLIEFEEEGKIVPRKVNGAENIGPEYEDILRACKVAKEVKSPFKDLLTSHNRPPLIISVCMSATTQ